VTKRFHGDICRFAAGKKPEQEVELVFLADPVLGLPGDDLPIRCLGESCVLL
jgi:hypothetical protein